MSENQLQNDRFLAQRQSAFVWGLYRYILPITNMVSAKILAISNATVGAYPIAQYGHFRYQLHPLTGTLPATAVVVVAARAPRTRRDHEVA